MTRTLTHLKTVRFDPITYLKIHVAADMLGVTSSVYIRELVTNAVAHIELNEVNT